MDVESQITQSGQLHRVCNCCCRNLNICHFGALWNGPVGFNLTCKTCRKQAQKKYFAKNYPRKSVLRAKSPDFISSLVQHNQTMLARVLTSDAPVEIGGISTLDGSHAQIKIQTIGRAINRRLRLQLFTQKSKWPFTVESATFNIERFIPYCLIILREQSIRILEPDEISQPESIFLKELAPLRHP